MTRPVPLHRLPGPACGSRRALLRDSANGFGLLALSALAAKAAGADAATGPLAPKPPHFPPRAKHVIFLCMQGGPSHVDTFDHKPKLAADAGQMAPAAAGRAGRAALLAPRWKFSQRGTSGLWVSSLFDEVAAHADKLCVINSMATDLPAHPQAFAQLHTGATQFVRPSLGAWTLYGLGTENQNLPGFIVINPPAAAARTFGSAFLPAAYQATRVGRSLAPGFAGRGGGDPAAVDNIDSPLLDRAAQRTQVDLVQRLNASRLALDGGSSPDTEGVIESYELAFRMQDEVPKVMDVSRETKATFDRYGVGADGTDGFGRQCLMARRLVEAGVRFVQVTHGNWDQHFNLGTALENNARQVDRPIAGLLGDLADRGLLDETLVIWGGEFGRTPHSQGTDGRDHNNKGFTLWMAGGGVKGGMAYGATDDYGYEAVDKRMHIHDWHATILHLLGLDHERLTYPYAGRDFRLTDVHGTVAREILA
ncbi:MAG: DUF1501 domain-containing protein [Planctomycetia bacterium]|nr:DUF1501 domain-containing protein [Planctomycetia bacterium]